MNVIKGALPSYANPPISEVVFGSQFKPLTLLTLPHIGLFWSQVKDKFSRAEHAPPIFEQSDIATFGASLPAPRIWLIDPTDTRLLQIQNDRFHFNWRQQVSSNPYPRFPELSENYFRFRNSFREFLEKHGLGLLNEVSHELSYVNVIPRDGVWKTASDYHEVFRGIPLGSPNNADVLRNPISMGWQLGFQMPGEAGRLAISVREAKRRNDNEPALLLELAAKGKARGDSDREVSAWFDLAHEVIVRAFSELTTERIQRETWKRVT